MGTAYRYVRVFGSNREQTEDAAEVFEHGDTVVVVLADGVGGIHGGVTASRALVAAVKSAMSDAAHRLGDVRYWGDLFRTTDATLTKSMAGQTTGVVVALNAGKLIGVSAGDSEAWVVEANRVENLTVGQNLKGRIGSGHVAPTGFERLGFLDGVLVVASDGLFKHAAANVIARIIRGSPIGVAAEHLIELVRLPSGKFPDDVTAVLVSGVEGSRGVHPRRASATADSARGR